MTQPLSPAAQAVLNAANGACSYGPDDVLNDSRQIAAAALRAAASCMEFVQDIAKLHQIAAELEGQPPTQPTKEEP